eukprot:6858372-Pyramimonas_sp.AAC.1
MLLDGPRRRKNAHVRAMPSSEDGSFPWGGILLGVRGSGRSLARSGVRMLQQLEVFGRGVDLRNPK